MISCLLVLLAFLAIPTVAFVGPAAPSIVASFKTRGFWRTVGLPFAYPLSYILHVKPLPTWTNLPLIGLMLTIWAYAIGLMWWADSRVFVTAGLVVIGALFIGVFAKVNTEA